MWNPVLELLFHVAYVDEVDLGRIAHSCHFTLYVLCYKADVHCPDARSIRHHCLK